MPDHTTPNTDNTDAETLLARLTQLVADQISEQVLEALDARDRARDAAGGWQVGRLVSLDELVATLPPSKKPETWKRWLYERSRHGQIPGCLKLGGSLFFHPEQVHQWLEAGAPSQPPDGTGCLPPTEQQCASMHDTSSRADTGEKIFPGEEA